MASSAVTVAVRCRPFSQREIDAGAENVISMEGNSTSIVPGDKRATGKGHTFAFDYSFNSFDHDSPSYASQEVVYNSLGKAILENTFDGYNSCLFAYGQTGSGKTYTMLGYGDDVGIIPRICKELFLRAGEKMQSSDGNWDCRVQVSYMEIYNERCRCLLNPRAKECKPREHPVTGPYVDGLTQVIVYSFEEIERLMDEGNKTRTVACTNMNATSSRSHAIFTINFTQMADKKTDPRGKGTEKVSRINLVDLAGSERADKTGATGDTLKEGANINKSLVCLGKVIAALADQAAGDKKKKGSHIPFRDSALTWVLKENLGGNSRTIMLAALSPHQSNYEESLSTLRYADRAKRIKTHAVVNEDPTSKRIRELQEEVERLKMLLSEATPAKETKPQEEEGEEEEEGGASPRGGEEEYESLSAAQQLAMTAKALEEASMSWDAKEEQNKEIKEERQKALEDMGIVVEMDKSRPSLVNLNEDPFMSECLVYYLKDPGVTVVGSGEGLDEKPDIKLEGYFIAAHHCDIEIGSDESGEDVARIKVHGDAEVYVNGSTVQGTADLPPRARIILGQRHVFRFSHPRLDGKLATNSSGQPVDYFMAMQEKFEKEKEKFRQELISEVQSKGQQQEVKVAETERRARASSLRRQQAEAKIKELERNLKLTTAPNSLTAITGATPPPQNPEKLAPAGSGAQSRGGLQTSAGGRIKHVDVNLFSANRRQVQRIPPQLMRRYKLILIGHEEVGKTSLRKCWQSDPMFFKKLPEVMCTTGIEVQSHRLKYTGYGMGSSSDDDLELSVLDFAGQEVYHSHSLFLTPRTVYCFVWKMSNVSQDDENCGMSDFEEERMMNWLDEVYSKAPGACAVIIGTHKDELQDQRMANINLILKTVKERFEEYVRSIRISDDPDKTVKIVGSYAVSCKTRQAFGGEFQSEKGAKMSELLRSIGKTAFTACLADRQYPSGAIPGRHVQFLRELERIKKERKKLLLPIQEYAQLAAEYGIDEEGELADCTMLFHCWNVVYLFTQAKRLLDNPYIFLHPLWLSHMVSALFSFAHVMYTPPEMRKYIGGLDYDQETALRADKGNLRRGELTLELAKVILARSIQTIRNEKPTGDSNFTMTDLQMCLQLLISMDLVFQHVLSPQELKRSETLKNEVVGSAAASRYYVPSLFPILCPAALKEAAPYLFQKGLNRMYQFNIFPKEFYYRLVCRLHQLLIPIEVPTSNASVASELGSDVKYLTPEAKFELRNHWKDGMWIGSGDVRALVFQEDALIYAYFLPEPEKQDADDTVTTIEFIGFVDEIIHTLAEEYDGLSVTCCQPCLEPECENWFDVEMLKQAAANEGGQIECQGCKSSRPADQILGGGGMDVAAGDELWDDLWPNLTAALGSEQAPALLRALKCYVEDDAVHESGEDYLKNNPATVGEWLDKYVKVVMCIEHSQGRCAAKGRESV